MHHLRMLQIKRTCISLMICLPDAKLRRSISWLYPNNTERHHTHTFSDKINVFLLLSKHSKISLFDELSLRLNICILTGRSLYWKIAVRNIKLIKMRDWANDKRIRKL